MALYPSKQNKVYQEVKDCIGTRDKINWESLRNLKYTGAFIKEVLRLHPPIERIERIVTKSCTLESSQRRQYSLSPGIICTILLSAVHFDPEYFAEPKVFKPSRFYDKQQQQQQTLSPELSPRLEKSNLSNLNTTKFLAFGLGTRTCIGIKVIFYFNNIYIY